MSTAPFSSNTVSESEILRVLREHGVLQTWENNVGILLRALPINPRRADRDRRRSFLLCQQDQPLAHLTVGPKLESLHARTQAFSQACPELACRALFFVQHDGIDYLAREYVPGTTLDDLVRANKISAEQAAESRARALRALEQSTTASMPEAAHAEASEIFSAFEQLPTLSRADREIIRETIMPIVLGEVVRRPSTRRWSNGDFTPRNLILNTAGELRLIDYEFAQITHFPEEDEWRWQTFSSPDFRSTTPFPAWMETFFWLKQMVLSHANIAPGEDAKDADHALERIAQQLLRLTPSAGSSLVRHLIAQSPVREENARLVEANAILSDKLQRTLNSRSWRLTAWLRAIRRVLSNRSS